MNPWLHFEGFCTYLQGQLQPKMLYLLGLEFLFSEQNVIQQMHFFCIRIVPDWFVADLHSCSTSSSNLPVLIFNVFSFCNLRVVNEYKHVL